MTSYNFQDNYNSDSKDGDSFIESELEYKIPAAPWDTNPTEYTPNIRKIFEKVVKQYGESPFEPYFAHNAERAAKATAEIEKNSSWPILNERLYEAFNPVNSPKTQRRDLGSLRELISFYRIPILAFYSYNGPEKTFKLLQRLESVLYCLSDLIEVLLPRVWLALGVLKYDSEQAKYVVDD